MSVRIETLGTRTRMPQTAWLVLIAALLAAVAVLGLLSRVSPDVKAPVRPPAVTTTVDTAPGAAIKAVANDPYLRVRPAQAADPASSDTVTGSGFGPTQNMGRACPKCW